MSDLPTSAAPAYKVNNFLPRRPVCKSRRKRLEATEKHPAQVEVYYEAVVVGNWRTIKFSGALPAQRINELLSRVELLQEAVKFAREEANSLEVSEQKVGAKILNYLFS